MLALYNLFILNGSCEPSSSGCELSKLMAEPILELAEVALGKQYRSIATSSVLQFAS